MVEQLLIKSRRVQALSGGKNPGVVVSFAPADVPYLTPEDAKIRMEAAKSGAATAFAGRVGTVEAYRRELPVLGRIVVVTNSPSEGKRRDFLEQDTGVVSAIAAEPQAIGVGYYPNSSDAASQRKIFRDLSDEVQAQGGEMPLVTFVYPDGPHLEGKLEVARRTDAVRDAAQRGADIVVIDHHSSEGDLEMVNAASDLKVPVFIRLSGNRDPRVTLQSAAHAREAGAAGVVLGNLQLPRGEGQPTLRKMIGEIANVVRTGKSPDDAYISATRLVL
jgi:DhnA family fructose-bisphosphate aldolase class Ia